LLPSADAFEFDAATHFSRGCAHLVVSSRIGADGIGSRQLTETSYAVFMVTTMMVV
jgi:hypothetical protein